MLAAHAASSDPYGRPRKSVGKKNNLRGIQGSGHPSRSAGRRLARARKETLIRIPKQRMIADDRITGFPKPVLVHSAAETSNPRASARSFSIPKVSRFSSTPRMDRRRVRSLEENALQVHARCSRVGLLDFEEDSISTASGPQCECGSKSECNCKRTTSTEKRRLSRCAPAGCIIPSIREPFPDGSCGVNIVATTSPPDGTILPTAIKRQRRPSRLSVTLPGSGSSTCLTSSHGPIVQAAIIRGCHSPGTRNIRKKSCRCSSASAQLELFRCAAMISRPKIVSSKDRGDDDDDEYHDRSCCSHDDEDDDLVQDLFYSLQFFENFIHAHLRSVQNHFTTRPLVHIAMNCVLLGANIVQLYAISVSSDSTATGQVHQKQAAQLVVFFVIISTWLSRAFLALAQPNKQFTTDVLDIVNHGRYLIVFDIVARRCCRKLIKFYSPVHICVSHQSRGPCMHLR